MVIIGLVGNKNVGKDTVADYFVKHGFKKITFASSLKKATGELFNWDERQLNEDKEIIDKNWGIAPRRILQILGTEFLREYCKDIIDTSISYNNEKKVFSYHIKKLFLDNKNDIIMNKNIIISDIRFLNEYNFVKWIGGKIIKINRNVKNNDFSNHKSEISVNNIKKFDYSIDNNFTLGHLYKTINLILENNIYC